MRHGTCKHVMLSHFAPESKELIEGALRVSCSCGVLFGACVMWRGLRPCNHQSRRWVCCPLPVTGRGV